MKRAASSFRLASRWQAGLVLLASCSFQNFDYLEGGGGNGGAGGGGAGGASATAGKGTLEAGSSSSPEGGMGDGLAGSFGGPPEGGKGGTDGGPAGGGGGDEGGTGGAAGEGTGNTGAVGQLVNPSFETSNTLGWTVEPSDALTKRHAFVQVAQGTATVPDGAYEFSTWHMSDSFAVEIHQTIRGLEDGTYTFKGYFSRGDGFNAVSMFARHCGGADPEPVPVPLTDPSQWLNVEVTGIEVVGGSCEVGLSIDSNPTNWLNADLFTFEKEVE